MPSQKCEHPNPIPAKLELGFAHSSEPDAPYPSPVNAYICKDCGHIDFYADQLSNMVAWLTKKQ